jgi:uridine kinase
MDQSRSLVLDALAAEIAVRRTSHALRVAVDGPDAAGKTTFADDLADRLAGMRPVIRSSIDGFHHPREYRLRRGALSPEGYYLDSFDLSALVSTVLSPLGPGGDRRYLRSIFDHQVDAPTEDMYASAPDGAVLLFDGVFLLRPQLRAHWDYSVYLHVPPSVSLDRARRRDLALFGSVDVVEERYRHRYLPGQERYRREADPLAHADVVLDLTDPVTPAVLAWR